jgi:hypothetical protein
MPHRIAKKFTLFGRGEQHAEKVLHEKGVMGRQASVI